MTITLYLSRVLVLSIGAAFMALGALAELLDLLENGNTVIARNGRFQDLALYAALITPSAAASVIPMASLTGALVTFGSLSNHNEIVALRTAGVTLYSIVSRLLPAIFAIGLLYFGMRFLVAPYTEIQVHEWLSDPDTVAETVDMQAIVKGNYWISSGPVIIAFESVAGQGSQIRQVIVFERDPRGRLIRHSTALSAQYDGAEWRFEKLTSRSVNQPGSPAGNEKLILRDGPLPIDILSATVPNARVRLRQPGISDAQVWAGQDSPAYHATNFYEAMTSPFVPLIMLLAAAPLALCTPRHPTLNRDTSIALGIGFGYLVTSGIFRPLGESGVMPPMIAASGPMVIYVLAALSVLVHREG